MTDPAKLLLLVNVNFYVGSTIITQYIACVLKAALLAKDRIISCNAKSFLKGEPYTSLFLT